ncbi:hypothetical protein D4764_0263800 [Takifugu flavidus]|uniref:Retrovirus-related Pol polyprotein from transposon TNT 1-94-like beta-barrel domain-containing protein n=1 Tax=Takifugu flavidus TaxID=433684 RepID=A0A5C6MG54_9TELE|nr:hypothetical protein D4764_0263800 [Takifugu flavidus]
MVDTGATSHVITDVQKFLKFDESFQPQNHTVELADGTRTNGVALRRGDAEATLVDREGKRMKATLKKALYVPTYPQDIFSVKAATTNGASVNFREGHSELIHKSGTRFDIKETHPADVKVNPNGIRVKHREALAAPSCRARRAKGSLFICLPQIWDRSDRRGDAAPQDLSEAVILVSSNASRSVRHVPGWEARLSSHVTIARSEPDSANWSRGQLRDGGAPPRRTRVLTAGGNAAAASGSVWMVPESAAHPAATSGPQLRRGGGGEGRRRRRRTGKYQPSEI